MYVIGLTGLIACGKSTVARMLGSLGAEAIDADAVAHTAMSRDTAVYRAVVARFGAGILQPDGEIDRRALGRMVFADPAALADLERLVHPPVIEETLRRVRQSVRPVVVVEAIKLLEAEMHQHCDAIWVVTCPYRTRLARMLASRHLSRYEALVRMQAQPPQCALVRYAHVVIRNGGPVDATWRQVVHHWNAIPGVVPIAITAPCPIPSTEGPVS